MLLKNEKKRGQMIHSQKIIIKFKVGDERFELPTPAV